MSHASLFSPLQVGPTVPRAVARRADLSRGFRRRQPRPQSRRDTRMRSRSAGILFPIRICRRGSSTGLRSRPTIAPPLWRRGRRIHRLSLSRRSSRRRPRVPDAMQRLLAVHRGSSRQQRIKRSRRENFTVVGGDGDLPSLAGKDSRLGNRDDQTGPLAFHCLRVAFRGYFVGHRISLDRGQSGNRLVRRFDRNPPAR
jgi:hypothetical protein